MGRISPFACVSVSLFPNTQRQAPKGFVHVSICSKTQPVTTLSRNPSRANWPSSDFYRSCM